MSKNRARSMIVNTLPMVCMSMLVLMCGPAFGQPARPGGVETGQDLPVRAVSPVADLLDRGVIEPDQARLVIETAYRTLEEYSGNALAFQLDGFRTIPGSQLDRVRLAEIATLPSGRLIDVSRRVRQNDAIGTSAVVYAPSWSTSEVVWLDADVGVDLDRVSVAEAFSQAAEGQPGLARVRALTTYSVTVTLEGESRIYQAAFLWLPSDESGRLTFFAIDHIVQGVGEAARETLPYGTGRPAGPGGVENVPAAIGNQICTAWSNSSSRTRELTGTNGHYSGDHHRSHAEFQVNCGCSSSCVSTCDAYVNNESCTDTGFFTIDACHKLASNVRASSDQVDDGPTGGAACAGGYGCVQKACLFCLCGLSVEVQISKAAKVTFGSSGDPNWQGNLEYSRTCGSCNPVEEYYVTTSGTHAIIPLAGANTYNPARVMVNIASGVSRTNARLTGQGHNQDAFGYVRVMRVVVNGHAYDVLTWLTSGSTQSFDFTIPSGILTAGWNDIRAYIHWGNDEYDNGHWVSVNLVLP